MSRNIRWLLLVVTHVLALGAGFALGIYTLPILIAPAAPAAAVVQSTAEVAEFKGEFRRDLEDSDALHWGDGDLYLSKDTIAFQGELAPGPDYNLYLSPTFVETEAAFNELKPQMVLVGPVRTFDNFTVAVPDSIDPAQYNSAIVWCESFGQFITATEYR